MAKRQRISNEIGNSYKQWKPDELIIIDSGTGTGKSYFIKNTLYKYAKKNGDKILFLVHRKPCFTQFENEIKQANKDDVITIKTYQKLESVTLIKMTDKYKYIVCDEFHYFISDSVFNDKTYKSFQQIWKANKSIRIFMSGTCDTMALYIAKAAHLNESELTYKKYYLPPDYSFIKHINFYFNDDGIDDFVNTVRRKKNSKGIAFINNTSKASNLFLKLKDDAIFNCSSQERNSNFKDLINHEAIDSTLINESFDSRFLITTSCMDAGLNIIDKNLKYMYIDNSDINSLFQCIGRKRITDMNNDRLELFIKIPTYKELKNKQQKNIKLIEQADYFSTHSYSEYIKKYPHGDKFKLLTTYSYKKEINSMLYEKILSDIDFVTMLEKQYNRKISDYISSKLNQYNMETHEYMYELFSINKRDKQAIKEYLKSIVRVPLYQPRDRKKLIQLIKAMDLNNQISSNPTIINANLQDLDIPYRIHNYPLTMYDENGTRHRYQDVWQVFEWDWSGKN